MDKIITIVLADDHHLVRQGIRLILETEGGFRLQGEAGDGLEALRLVEQFHPNVLVLDLMIPRLHGLEVVRQVRKASPETGTVILTMHADEPYVMEGLRNGALGYVLKDSTGSELVQAVRAVAGGRRYLSPSLAERAISGYIQKPDATARDIFETLTNRERLVLQLAAQGLTNPEVAAKLFISPRTAETHRANLMRKLELRSQTDLVLFAIRKGVISP